MCASERGKPTVGGSRGPEDTDSKDAKETKADTGGGRWTLRAKGEREGGCRVAADLKLGLQVSGAGSGGAPSRANRERKGCRKKNHA